MIHIDLSGRTALVTGASRGIGREIARSLGEAGANLVGVARTEEALVSLGEEIGSKTVEFLPLVADLSRPEGIPPLVADAWSWREGVDILVNAAGTIVRTDPPDVEVEDWDLVLSVNARAPFFLTQELGGRMLSAGGGVVVNVTSLAGQVVTKAAITYQASKAALIQMTRGFAARWAPSVRVNAVGPGYVRTSLNADWLAREENLAYVKERTPLGRVGVPEDVAGVVVFLASPAASYITGQHLLVDGGWSIR